MSENRTINISTEIILKVAAVTLGLWFLYLIRDIIAIFFVAIIITAAIEPAINWLEKKKIPRAVGVLGIYVALIFLLGFLFSFLIPSFISQTKDFTSNFPVYLERTVQSFQGIENYTQSKGIDLSFKEMIQVAIDNLSVSSKNVFTTTISFFSGFISTLIIFSLAFYMSVKKDGMRCFFESITPKIYREKVIFLAEKIKSKIGYWMIGQLFLMLIIFVLDYLLLLILKVPYALVLALIGGILEIIPYLGPIFSAVIATIAGFFVSPITGILVLIFYFVIQQTENHILIPQIMKKTLGLNPVAVILSLLIGIKVAGVIGVILAVPVATAIGVVIEYFLNDRRKSEKVSEEAVK